MIKVAATPEVRSQIIQLADVFRARVIDVSADSVIVEITGSGDKIERLIEVLTPYGVLEVARTGRVAMARGPRLGRTARGPLRGRRAGRQRGFLTPSKTAVQGCGCSVQDALCTLHPAPLQSCTLTLPQALTTTVNRHAHHLLRQRR